MKTILKSMRKKKDQWEDKPSGDKAPSTGAKEKTTHMLNPDLPRHRAARVVERNVIASLNTLRDTSAANRSKLFIRKDARDKEIKRSTILELVTYLTQFKPAFVEEELEEIFEMILCNLSRPLPPSTLDVVGMFNPEEDEPASEATWPHLQVVYEFLLRLATSTETDSKLLAKYFNRSFVLILLDLFDSEDPRERDYLKTILHRIYGNFMSLRPFIRRAINNVFFKFIYETDRHNGIAELLEILGSIINGFALPIKEQHKQFLSRVLLPLHKATYVSVFHPQLSYCITQFLEKDATLAPKIVKAILKFWPVTNSKKELMFLTEIEEVLDRVQSHHLQEAQVPLFQQIANSINSPHFQVSERAIYVLNNDVILRFITNNREVLVPILNQALVSNTFAQKDPEAKKRAQAAAGSLRWEEQGHWNATIVELTQDILKLFNEMDQGLMDKCNAQNRANLENRARERALRELTWAGLEKS